MPVSPYGGIIFAALAAVGGAMESHDPIAADATPALTLAADESVTVDQVKAICAKEEAEIITASTDPASGTSLHLALVDSSGAFMAGEVIEISGQQLKAPHMRMRCRGDWLMMKLQPGHYTIKAEADGQVRTRDVDVPKDGRVRLALNFGARPAS
jgi:hypothetical protein